MWLVSLCFISSPFTVSWAVIEMPSFGRGFGVSTYRDSFLLRTGNSLFSFFKFPSFYLFYFYPFRISNKPFIDASNIWVCWKIDFYPIFLSILSFSFNLQAWDLSILRSSRPNIPLSVRKSFKLEESKKLRNLLNGRSIKKLSIDMRDSPFRFHAKRIYLLNIKNPLGWNENETEI